MKRISIEIRFFLNTVDLGQSCIKKREIIDTLNA